MTYPDVSSRSNAIYERAKRSLPGGNTRTTVYMKPYPIYAARGAGCRVWDVDDVSRIDCINNFTSLIHGHAHPVLVEAATKQLALGTAFGMPTESEVDLAELLCGRVASVEEIRFSNSGRMVCFSMTITSSFVLSTTSSRFFSVTFSKFSWMI